MVRIRPRFSRRVPQDALPGEAATTRVNGTHVVKRQNVVACRERDRHDKAASVGSDHVH